MINVRRDRWNLGVGVVAGQKKICDAHVNAPRFCKHLGEAPSRIPISCRARSYPAFYTADIVPECNFTGQFTVPTIRNAPVRERSKRGDTSRY